MEAHPWSHEGLPGVPGLIMPPWSLILEQQVYPGTMGANFCTTEAHHGDVRQTWDHPGNVGACPGAKG